MATLRAIPSKSVKRVDDGRSEYHSYVLRVWHQENCSTKRPDWRFALEVVRNGNILGFTSLEAMFTALSKEIGIKERGDEEIKSAKPDPPHLLRNDNPTPANSRDENL